MDPVAEKTKDYTQHAAEKGHKTRLWEQLGRQIQYHTAQMDTLDAEIQKLQGPTPISPAVPVPVPAETI